MWKMTSHLPGDASGGAPSANENAWKVDSTGYEHLSPQGTDEFVVADQDPKVLNYKEVRALMRESAHRLSKPEAEQLNGTKAVMRIQVDRHGNYLKHRVVSSTDPLCTQIVEQHISQLVFSPAVYEGKPIVFWVNLVFEL